MTRPTDIRWILTATAVVLLALSAPATLQAATFNVAANGEDSPECGPPTAPCESLQMAIDNADDGDTILVGPGFYELFCFAGGCRCGVLVDKDVSIRSTEGAEVTIFSADLGVDNVVCIEADGATFGLDTKGFTLFSGNQSGVFADADDVYVGGNTSYNNNLHGFEANGTGHTYFRNWAIRNDDVGFDLETVATTLSRNRAILNSEEGFRLNGVVDGKKKEPVPQENVLTFNVAYLNREEGFDLDDDAAENTLDKNLASLNLGEGLHVQGLANTIRRFVSIGNGIRGVLNAGDFNTFNENHLVDNGSEGLNTSSAAVTITRSNLHGNTRDDADGCQLRNNSGVMLFAPANFFGVPIPPPTDLCGDPTDRMPIRTSEYSSAFGWLPVP